MFLPDVTLDATRAHKNQRWRGLDPRACLLCAFGLSVGVSLASDTYAALLWLGAGLVALALALPGSHRGTSPALRARLWPALLSVNLFMLAVWATLPLSLPWPEAAALATLLTLKANAALTLLLALCGGLSLPAAAAGLRGLGLPSALVALFLLTCRQLHSLQHELRVSLQALRLRVPSPRPRQALYLYACLVASVLVRAADQAALLRMVLASKGLTPTDMGRALPEALHGRLHWAWRESALCALCVLLCGAQIWNLQGGYGIAQALAHF